MKNTRDNNMQMDPETERKVNAVVLQAREAGLPGFLFAFRDSGKTTVRFENIKTIDAITVSGLAWQEAIMMELRNNPDYAPEFKQIFLDAIESFKANIQAVNKKVAEYKKEHGE